MTGHLVEPRAARRRGRRGAGWRACLSTLCAAWAAASATGCDPCDPPLDCDLRERPCQARALDAMQCVLGLEAREVQVRVMDHDDFAQEYIGDADETEGSDCTRQWYRALALVDLVEPGLGHLEARGVLAGQVGAFYSSEDQAITLLDTGHPFDGISALTTFVHESVHALQDAQHPDAGPFDDSSDAHLAFSAVVEGQAVLYSLRVWAEAFGFDRDDPDYALAADTYVANTFDDLFFANPWLSERRAFVYPHGLRYTWRRFDRGGHRALEALLEDPPATTRAVLTDEPVDESAPHDAWDAESVPDLSAHGLHLAAVQRVGAFTLAALRQRLDGSPNDSYTAGPEQALASDLMSLHVTAGGDEAALAWRLSFDTAEAARELRDLLARGLADQEPLWGTRSWVLDGRQVTLVATTARGAIAAGDLDALSWGSSSLPQYGGCDPPDEVAHLDAPRAIDVDTGPSHSCALLDNGAVRCWGEGEDGRLGHGDTDALGDDELPLRAGDVPLGQPAVAIAVADGHSCAALADGSVRCWGDNAGGQVHPELERTEDVGDDETPERVEALRAAGGEAFVGVAAGPGASCGLTDGGGLQCWGDGAAAVPVDALPRPVRQLELHGAHACALVGEGEVVCWTGDPDAADGLQWLDVGGPARQLALGDGHGCARREDGDVHCWRLTPDPREFAGGDAAGLAGRDLDLDAPAIDVSAAADRTCAVLEQGAVMCFGPDPAYDGSGSPTASFRSPAPEGALELRARAVGVSVAPQHTCALLQSGQVRCFGGPPPVLLGLGDDRRDFGPVAAHWAPNVALY